MNANSNTILRGGIIGKFSLGENTFIEASIQMEKEPLLLVFCREENLFTVCELCFREDYYDMELALKEIGIKFEIKKDAIFLSFVDTPLKEDKELIVGSFSYSLCCKYQMVWDKWYYFETQSLKAFIENEDFKLFSFVWRSLIPVKTRTREFASKMISGKKVTLNNLRKILSVDDKELDTKIQEECQFKTSEFSLVTILDEVFYCDNEGNVKICNELIGFPDFFITKLFTAGAEGKSREIISKYFCE